MSIFKRKQQEEIKGTITTDAPETKEEQPAVQEQPEEEWIWVEGYKGTDANMCCRGYQYEIGKQYDMPEGVNVKTCDSGFHLCKQLSSVFNFYMIGQGNRFFKVRALVRKKDAEYAESVNIGYYTVSLSGNVIFGGGDKMASKSIIFVSELTQDEVLKGTDVENLSKKYKDLALKVDVSTAYRAYQTNILEKDGYSKTFAAGIVNRGLFDKAHAVGSQSDLSMDMKVWYILS